MMPHEIVTAPFSIWTAPYGTAFPSVHEQPGAGWALLGKRGARSQSREGVSVRHQRQNATSQPAGSLAPTFGFPIADGLSVRVLMLDLTLEQYSRAVGGNPVTRPTPDPASAGVRTVGLGLPARSRPPFALLVRGASPYGDESALQYEVPRCIEMGAGPDIVFRGRQPAGLALEFLALEDPAATSEETRFARLTAGYTVRLIEFQGSAQSGPLGIDGATQTGNFEQEF